MKKNHFIWQICIFLIICIFSIASAKAQTYKYKYVYTERSNGARIIGSPVCAQFNNYITFINSRNEFYTSDSNGYGNQYSATFKMTSSNPLRYRKIPNNSMDATIDNMWNNAMQQTNGYHFTGTVGFTDSYKYMLVSVSNGNVDVYERQ